MRCTECPSDVVPLFTLTSSSQAARPSSYEPLGSVQLPDNQLFLQPKAGINTCYYVPSSLVYFPVPEEATSNLQPRLLNWSSTIIHQRWSGVLCLLGQWLLPNHTSCNRPVHWNFRLIHLLSRASSHSRYWYTRPSGCHGAILCLNESA